MNRPPMGRPRGGPMGGRGRPTEKAKDAKGVLLRLMGYLKKEKKTIFFAFFMVALSTLCTLGASYLIRPLINDYILPGDFSGLAGTLGIMIILYALSSGSSYFQNTILIRISQRMVANMREELFSKMERLPIGYFDTHSHGDLMSRYTNDMDTISNTLSTSLVQLISSGITFAGLLVLMLVISPILTIITALIIPILLVIVSKLMKQSRKYFSAQQRSLGELNGYIEEMIEGQKVVKVFTREEELMEDFGKINEVHRQNATRAQIYSGIAMPIVQNINLINYAFTAAVGGLLAVGGMLDIGGLAVFLGYSRQFSQPLNQISSQLNSMQSALAGAERVFEMMDELPEDINDSDEGEPEVEGDVEISDVCFSYVPEKPVLKHINISVKKGQRVALVGSTGAGKTTITNLLTRFYEINSGSISIDGKPISEMSLYHLRESLGLVLQDTHLFTGTVMENIRYGRLDATDEECIRAASLVHADGFIRRLPNGYDTLITGDGLSLSQGQRQLLGIARAAVKDPPILILDEATSSIDTRTERLIQQGMDVIMEGRTCFVIAHRISTIVNSDLICVIEKGEIIESGSHAELIALGGRYAALHSGQFELD